MSQFPVAISNEVATASSDQIEYYHDAISLYQEPKSFDVSSFTWDFNFDPTRTQPEGSFPFDNNLDLFSAYSRSSESTASTFTSSPPFASATLIPIENSRQPRAQSVPGPIRSPRGSIAEGDSIALRASSPDTLRCSVTDCNRRFRRRCELKRHTDKHEKPFMCHHILCAKAFGSKADLERHLREVHFEDAEAFEFRCPVNSCKRNRAGFTRKWNLQDHCRRIHHQRLSSMLVGEENDSTSDDSSDSSDLETAATVPPSSTYELPIGGTSMATRNVESFFKIRLDMQNSLNELLEQRGLVDNKIATLRKAMLALEEGSGEQRR